MKNFDKKLNSLKKVKMTEKERSERLSSLLSYAEANPPTPATQERVATSFKQLWLEKFKALLDSTSILVHQKKFARALVVVAFILFVSAGTSLSARSALPGDVLYPVKVRVNEKVLDFLIIDSELEVKWEIEKAERRLLEAEELISLNQYDDDIDLTLRDRFSAHVEAFNQKSKDSEDDYIKTFLGSDFEALLLTHIDVLDDLSKEQEARKESKEKDEEELSSLLLLVQTASDTVGDSRTEAEDRYINALSVLGPVNPEIFGYGWRETDEILEKLEDKVEDHTYDEKNVINSINNARQGLTEAKLESQDAPSAYRLLFNARRDTAKASALSKVNLKLQGKSSGEDFETKQEIESEGEVKSAQDEKEGGEGNQEKNEKQEEPGNNKADN